MEETFDFIRNNGKCCISGKPLKDSQHITMVSLDFSPTWNFPVMENFIYKTGRRAVAYVHDDCIVNGKLTGKIKYAVEFNNKEIIYHDIPYIRYCRVCGCYELDACIHEKHGNCFWVEEDLCSHCKDYPGEAKRYSLIIRDLEKKQQESLRRKHQQILKQQNN